MSKGIIISLQIAQTLIHWKDWCWSWNSQYFGHLMRRTDSLEKTLMLGKIEGRKRRGWQRTRWLDGIIDSMDMSLNKDGEGQGSLACCSPWGCKELDMTEQLKNNNSGFIPKSLINLHKFSIVNVSVCIPTNSVRGFPFLHTLFIIYCLQTFWWWSFWLLWDDTSWFWFSFL